MAYCTVFQVARVVTLAAGSTTVIETPIILPCRQGQQSKYGAFKAGIFVEGPYVAFRCGPASGNTAFRFQRLLSVYSLDGDWLSSAFQSDYALEEVDFSADLLASGGSMTFDLREDGPCKLSFIVSNLSASPASANLQLLVSSRTC